MRVAQALINDPALRQGLVWGTILGAMWLVSNVVSNLANLDATGETWLKYSLLVVMIILLCLWNARRVKSWSCL